MIAKSVRDRARRQRAIDYINDRKRSAKCFHCGLADARCLEFHHWNPASKSFGISEAIRLRLRLERIAAEIAKCVAVCSNCHQIIEIECII